MALRKIYLGVNCTDDNERNAVQSIADELTRMNILNAQTILRMMPVFNKNQVELTQLFSMVSKNGVKSLLSLKGGLLLRKLASK